MVIGALGFDTQNASGLPDPNPTINANILPLVVPMLNQASDPNAAVNTGGVVTTPSSISNTPTAVGSSTQFSLGAYLVDVVEHPIQHWIAAIVLLLVALWFYKHFLKGLFKAVRR